MKLFERIPDKKNIPWLVVSTVFLMLSICLHTVFTGIRAGGNCGDTEYNLDIIQENLVDYTDVNTGKDIDGTPRKPSTFLLVHQNLEREWILRYQSDRKLDKKQWTTEDLKRFDTVVIARSLGKMEPYREHMLGNMAVVEYVTLLYYDTATGELVKTETISAKLPIRVPEANGYTLWWGIAPSRITEKACRTLGVPFISGSLLSACRITALVTGIATAVLLLLRIRKSRKSRKRRKRRA